MTSQNQNNPYLNHRGIQPEAGPALPHDVRNIAVMSAQLLRNTKAIKEDFKQLESILAKQRELLNQILINTRPPERLD